VTRILAIADEVSDSLWSGRVRRLDPNLVVACGDLPFDYLEYIVTMVNVPLVFVPGNHDPDLKAKPQTLSSQDFQRPLSLATLRREPAGPMGCSNADGRVVDEAGVGIAGLGGSVRYKPGPNQYTQRQMTRRALRLELSSVSRRARSHGKIDILITHSPPYGIGDGDDPAHRGFIAFHRLVTRLSPKLLIHGHVHPYGRVIPNHRLGSTTIVNVVGHRMLEL